MKHIFALLVFALVVAPQARAQEKISISANSESSSVTVTFKPSSAFNLGYDVRDGKDALQKSTKTLKLVKEGILSVLKSEDSSDQRLNRYAEMNAAVLIARLRNYMTVASIEKGAAELKGKGAITLEEFDNSTAVVVELKKSIEELNNTSRTLEALASRK